SAPTATVSPSLAAISASTPAAGAGTSIVTLSVSSSTSGSSTATGSPGFLNHLPIVASVTDSPSVGTRVSAVIVFPFFRHRRACTDHPRLVQRQLKSCGLLSQRLVQERLELREVLRHLAHCGRGCGRTPGIDRLLALVPELVEDPFEIRLQERVRAHVAGL